MKKNSQTKKLHALYIGGIFMCISLFSGLYTVIAATGKANLSLVVADNTLAPGEQTTASIILNTAGLVLSGSEDIGTISIFVDFPADQLEVVGNINFTNSAFPTPYVGTVSNADGTIEIVRARDPSTPLPPSAAIGSVTFRVKNNAAPGNAEISFSHGLNNILLNDSANTDVVGSLTGGIIVIPDNSPSATPTPTSGGQVSPTPPGTPGVTKVWMTLDKPDLKPGETTVARIRLDTGNKSISSVDLRFSYPTELLKVNGTAVDLDNGAFESAVANVIDPQAGSVSVVLFSNPAVVSSSAFIGSFSVTRLGSGQSGIFLQKNSGAFMSDVNNTNALSIADSFGVTLPEITGAVIQASLLQNSISTAESAVLTFTSSATGIFRIKKNTCDNLTTLTEGNVAVAGAQYQATVPGSQIGAGASQKLVVCVTDGNALTSSSNQLTIAIAASSASENITNPSSGTSGGGGGGGGGTNNTNSVTRPFPGAVMNTESPPPDCQYPTNFHAESMGNGRMLFTWDKLTDTRITGLELHYGKESGNLLSTIELPLIPKMIFPGKGLDVGSKYYFALATVGAECPTGFSAEVSATKRGNQQMATQNPPVQNPAAGTSSSMDSQIPAMGGPADAAHEVKSVSGSGNSGAVSGSNKLAAKKYAQMPPHSAGSGPADTSGILAIFSALVAFYFLRKGSKVVS